MSQTTSFRPHPIHALWRHLPAATRRRALTYATARVTPRPDTAPPVPMPGLVVGGELSRASGLGEGARLMLRGAALLGLHTWPVEMGLPIGAPDHAPIAGNGSPPACVPLVVHVNAPLLPLALLRGGRALRRNRRIIGYWAWELPVAPPEWRDALPFVHEVWVPSRFTAAALDPLLPGRVRVVRPPMATLPMTPSALDRAAFGLPPDAVVVLVSFNLASSFVRKNPLAAIAAFRQAFGDRRDRLLLLKVLNPDHFPRDFTLLTEAVAGWSNIRIETRVMPPADRLALTRAADIVLSLHRSEGLGLVAAEAMLLGKPVIATGWSGNLDFMDETTAALVPVRLVPARDPRGVLEVEGAVWAEPDINVAAAQLRWLADDATGRWALGQRGRAMARERLGLGTLASALHGIGLPVP